jgi:Chalcone isomerase-like
MIRPLVRLLQRALLVALLLAAAAASATKIAGENFDERIRLADTELLLNGVGLRAVLMFKGYAAGLYLVAKGRTAEQVLAQKGAKRMQIKMLIDVETKEFVKAIDVGMRRNHNEAEHLVLQERITQLNKNIEAIGTVKKGDVVNLDYLPALGLVLTLNGAQRGEPVVGEDLYAGVLKIFIGELPVDKKLKAGLLGHGAP